MLDVFYTVDVEVWCDGWTDLEARFADGFSRCIHARTVRGDYGVRFQAQALRAHGLHGVFFVEPLFASRFGLQPLAEIVGEVKSAGQEVQLHLHTEWACESPVQWIAGQQARRQNLFDFDRADQERLIDAGRTLLNRAGADRINAFRAGNFGANPDTLGALQALGFTYDSSVNARHAENWFALVEPLDGPFRFGTLTEVPMTVFDDGSRHVRQVALTAISVAELEGLLWTALESGRRSFVILAHSFELLDASRRHRDDTVLRRFEWLCNFLARHKDVFRTVGFSNTAASNPGRADAESLAVTDSIACSDFDSDHDRARHGMLQSPWHRTWMRHVEQGLRRRHAWGVG